jgi:hypothetical protein
MTGIEFREGHGDPVGWSDDAYDIYIAITMPVPTPAPQPTDHAPAA